MHSEKPERDPRFNLKHGQHWFRGARVSRNRAPPPPTRKRK